MWLIRKHEEQKDKTLGETTGAIAAILERHHNAIIMREY